MATFEDTFELKESKNTKFLLTELTFSAEYNVQKIILPKIVPNPPLFWSLGLHENKL